MADAKQVQIRRDTAANLAFTTPVEAELGYDQTNKRLLIGDGTTLGGIILPNYIDARIATYNRGSVGGTANAITLTMAPASVSYQTGMEISFIATGSNTGSVTIDVDGLGTRNIQKLKSGTLQNLEAGDLVSGSTYKIIYNGTLFQLITLYRSGIESVSQGDLNTSTGTFSALTTTLVAPSSTIYFANNYIITPGGQYGFSILSSSTLFSAPCGWWYAHNSNAAYASSVIPISMGVTSNALGNQRYVTASPPYDIGDGEVAGFIFALVNEAGDIVSHYSADAPPWAYNGPTDIRCTHKCPVTGKKYRMAMKKRSFEEVMEGAPIKYEKQEITHKLKNKDMGIIPHPFGNIPAGHRVVLLDPMDDKIRRIIEYQNAGGTDWVDQIKEGKILIDSADCKRCGPKGVSIHKMKYKYTKKF